MAIERPTFHESWYRVADIHPRLSNRVQVSRQHFRGQPWFVIQDHTNNAFFRLAEPAYRFVGLLDGKRTVGEAWKITNDQLGDEAPTQGEVIQLLGQLYTANLLQAEVPADTHTLFARYKKRKQREITSYLMNIMFARIPLIDPDAFLNRWLPLMGWVFSPIGLVVWIILIASGAYSIAQKPGWSDALVNNASGLLSPENLILLYVGFAFIKGFHEMGHAVSCKKFGKQSGTGGEVHVIGIMFLVFTPVPYVDASSSWALTNKWHRAIVGAAGMWVELGIASIAAIVWSQTPDSHWINAFAYNIMFVASFSTVVFNANPLLRYDGYYILSDLLEIPNLAHRGKEYIFYLVKKYVWNVRFARNPAHGRTERIWLFVYAIASFIMRVVVTFSIMFYLTTVLEGALIIVATAMAIAGLLTWVLVPTGKFLYYLTTSTELSRTRTRALITSALAIVAIVVAVGFVPFPDYARAQGVVEPSRDNVMELFVVHDGEVEMVNLKGRPYSDKNLQRLRVQYVHAGDLLLETTNREMEQELVQHEIQLERANLDLKQVQAESPSEILTKRAIITGIQGQIQGSRERLQQLKIMSPLTGVLVMPEMEKSQSALVKLGDRIGMVANIEDLIIRAAFVNELGQYLNEEGDRGRVEIRVSGRPDILLTGEAYMMLPAGSKNLPSPALGYQFGGEFSTSPTDQQGTETVANFFEVRLQNLKLQAAPGALMDDYKETGHVPLLPGQRVVVRVKLKPKPLAVQGWIKLQQMFQRNFHM